MTDSTFAPFGAADEQTWVVDFDSVSPSTELTPPPPTAPSSESLVLAATVLDGLSPPGEVDESPYNNKLELPPTLVPFERTIASERLAGFCRSVLGYEPVYAAGKAQSLSGMAALKTVLGITDSDPASSLFE
jgi:hypothetical protein